MVLFCALWRYTKWCCELSSGIQGVSCLNMYKRISKANVRFSVPLIIIRPNSVVTLKEQRIPLYQKEGLQDDRSQPSENWYWHKKMSKYRVRETIKSVQTTSELNLEHFFLQSPWTNVQNPNFNYSFFLPVRPVKTDSRCQSLEKSLNIYSL